jgi:hypothetical protein
VDGNDSSSNTITSPDHRSISSSLRPPISTTQLGDIDTEYDQKIAEIKEYYFIETVQVAHAETLAREDDDRKEIQLTKAAILHAFEVAKRFERNLPVALTLAVSALGIASNLLLGYLLNSTGGLEVIAASALFLFNLAADLVASLSDVYRSPANWTIVGERLTLLMLQDNFLRLIRLQEQNGQPSRKRSRNLAMSTVTRNRRALVPAWINACKIQKAEVTHVAQYNWEIPDIQDAFRASISASISLSNVSFVFGACSGSG